MKAALLVVEVVSFDPGVLEFHPKQIYFTYHQIFR